MLLLPSFPTWPHVHEVKIKLRAGGHGVQEKDDDLTAWSPWEAQKLELEEDRENETTSLPLKSRFLRVGPVWWLAPHRIHHGWARRYHQPQMQTVIAHQLAAPSESVTLIDHIRSYDMPSAGKMHHDSQWWCKSCKGSINTMASKQNTEY